VPERKSELVQKAGEGEAVRYRVLPRGIMFAVKTEYHENAVRINSPDYNGGAFGIGDIVNLMV
jgi:hypothetical protein